MLNRTSRFNTVLFHAIVLAFVCLPYCINLGRSSIWDANEAFYAETPREMITRSDYLAPHFNFQPRAQKPPLTYWAVLISYKLFGIGEFAVRFPSALAAIGTILFSYALARLLHGNSAALFSAIITGTTARVFILARRLPIDIILLFFLTGTLYFIVRALQKKPKNAAGLRPISFQVSDFSPKAPSPLSSPPSPMFFACFGWNGEADLLKHSSRASEKRIRFLAPRSSPASLSHGTC